MSGPEMELGISARNRNYQEILEQVLNHASQQDWAGHNKHDALNSPLLWKLFGWSRWSRILAIQMVMRFPWNLRSLLRVPKTRNAKGQGLFASAWLDLHAATGNQEHLAQARARLDWLLENTSTGFPGLSWGYPYPWQDVGFFAPRFFPNRVVTCWIGFAFAEALRQTGDHRYRDALSGIAEFLLRSPRILQDDQEMLCATYVPDPSVSVAVVDVPALSGAFLAEAGSLLGREDWVADARRLLNWVADKQTSYGAWYYTHPRGDSLITHDNYHTAIVVDCFDRYRLATGDDRYDSIYQNGLAFYRDHLITEGGAPRWMHDGQRATDYPFDVHGSGSAILCFARASVQDPEFRIHALRTLDWSLTNLYDGKGRFYYQKTRFFTKRFCLLRWCNGWMAWALAAWLRRESQQTASGGSVSGTPEHGK